MNDCKKATLVINDLRFFSKRDESVFFSWLNYCLPKCLIKGVGKEIVVEFDADRLTKSKLADLIGLFKRYDKDLSVLSSIPRLARLQSVIGPGTGWHDEISED